VERICEELERFSEHQTSLRIIVLWPCSEDEMKCMERFLTKLLERFEDPPDIFLWFTDGEEHDFPEVKMIQEHAEKNVHLIHQGLKEFCAELQRTHSSENNSSVPVQSDLSFKLPGHGGSTETCSQEEWAWLREQGMEVLYLDNPYKSKDLQSEAENFFKGGSISWWVRYHMQPNCFDVQREGAKVIEKHIKENFIEKHIKENFIALQEGRIFQLLHAPGSGGSTMARRILFDLHESTPCVHIMHQTESSTKKIAERLDFLYTKTQLPVVVLVDGGKKHQIKNIQAQLDESVKSIVIFLLVKRHKQEINPPFFNEHKSTFFLKGTVTEQESNNLTYHLKLQCKDEKKRDALDKLDMEVHNNQPHQMFEFGMTVYEHEFRGVRAFVEGYLDLGGNEGPGLEHLQPWQRCLGYLAVIFYYAGCSLPSLLVGVLMGKEYHNRCLSIKDLPHYMQMFVVADTNDDRPNCVRIMHYTVATEILEQILNPGGQGKRGEKLSEGARQNLKQFCLEFLEQIREDQENHHEGRASRPVQDVLTKVFILREKGDPDSEHETNKKIVFSQIILDILSVEPYNERLEVFQKLCETCPNDGSFKAHLGRFYSLCQRKKEEQATQCFKDAIQDAIKHGSNDLGYIYHMYGCFLKRKIRNNVKLATYSLDDMLKDGKKACEMFRQCRAQIDSSLLEAFHFMGEIDLRLQICHQFNERNVGGLKALLSEQHQPSDWSRFVCENIYAIDDLIKECKSSVHMNKSGIKELQNNIILHKKLFSGCLGDVNFLQFTDPLTRLRAILAAKKVLCDEDDKPFVLNKNIATEDLHSIVDLLEKIHEHRNDERPEMRRKLDEHYCDWILVIRRRELQVCATTNNYYT
jgi:hypothetical protein